MWAAQKCCVHFNESQRGDEAAICSLARRLLPGSPIRCTSDDKRASPFFPFLREDPIKLKLSQSGFRVTALLWLVSPYFHFFFFFFLTDISVLPAERNLAAAVWLEQQPCLICPHLPHGVSSSPKLRRAGDTTLPFPASLSPPFTSCNRCKFYPAATCLASISTKKNQIKESSGWLIPLFSSILGFNTGLKQRSNPLSKDK